MIITFYKTNQKGGNLYYTIHNHQRSLFFSYSFTAIWGNNIQTGREKTFTFASRQDMDAKLKKIFHERIKKEYKILYSFSTNIRYKEMFQQIEKEMAG